MDESTTIGVIELKTCIQAIVQCSPELVATLGQDYTVYAYDFSEYEIPLVGQGMLSWALATASPTPDCPASESQKLITGRVCKNIQGLFSNGVKETLEVKLRLVPVPTVLQSEYLNNMQRYRDVSQFMPANLDQQEWMGLLRSNPNIGQMAQSINSMAPGSSHEVVNQLLSPSLSQHNSDPFHQAAGSDGVMAEGRSTPSGGRAGATASRPSSRVSVKRARKPRVPKNTGGNTSGYEDGTDGEEGQTGRKRAKIVQSEWNGKSAFGAKSESLLVAASTTNSIRTFRPIAVNPNSNAVSGSHLQEVPRAPTPVPAAGGKNQSLQRTISQNFLRRDSIASQASQPRYQSPYPDISSTALPTSQEVRMSIESAMSSPEKNNESSGETPPDIASSPPVLLRGVSTTHSSPQAPSSPVLPQMPRQESSFEENVDNINDLFGDDELRLPDNHAVHGANQYSARPASARFQEDLLREQPQPRNGTITPAPSDLLPRSPAVFEPRHVSVPISRPGTSHAQSRAYSVMSDDQQLPPRQPLTQPSPLAFDNQTPAPGADQQTGNANDDASLVALLSGTTGPVSRPSTATPYAPSYPQHTQMNRTASIGSLTLPTAAPTESMVQQPTLLRAQTWSEAPCPPSDFYPASESNNSTTRGVLAKKASIKQKLEDAVQKGEMPPYCHNCGAIETPTWRRCYAQDHQGKPGYHEYSDGPGKVLAIHVTARDEKQEPTAYKLYKKSLGPGDDRTAFDECLLCNPCGIWLSKFRQHRPEEKWSKDPPKFRPGRKGRKSNQGNNYTAMPTSEAYFQSDAPGPMDQYQNFVPEETNEVPPPQPQAQPPQQVMVPAQVVPPPQESHVSAPRPRATSMRPNEARQPVTSQAAVSALRRAIQSSPARYLGSHRSPIEIEDEDLGTTRRTLFPSPRKDGSPKVLGELTTNVVLPMTHQSQNNVKAALESADKENQAPPLDGNDPLEKLIEQALHEHRARTPEREVAPKSFKTPTRPTPTHRPVTRSISRSNRSARHDTLPQRTPSKTPTRRSPRHNNATIEESPFTRNLNQILSEAVDAADNNMSPSRHLDLNLDFLPALNSHQDSALSSDLFHLPGFDTNQDFFSTDVPMPSSPPRFNNFSLYEDPMSMSLDNLGGLNNDMWNDFQLDGEDAGELDVTALGLLMDENGKSGTFDLVKNAGKTMIIKKEPKEASGLDKETPVAK